MTEPAAGGPAPANMYDATVERLRLAGETHDPRATIALLADDVIIRSPITDRIRFEGVDQARDLFIRVFDTISEIRFYEVVGAGSDTQVIFWRGRVAGCPLEEANLLRIHDDGRIAEMTVFMRAVPGLLQLVAELAPSLAGRHGRARAALIRAQLRLFSLTYRAAEPLVLKLANAGVPAPDREAELTTGAA
jgi:ketosteroid isomerase-like protein